MNSWIQALRDAVRAEAPAAVTLRRELHRHPDLSGEEGPTAERVRRALGPVDWQPVAGTGLLARIGPADGPAIAIRAELDALPVAEATGVPWSATGTRMHACGHDVHLAALTALCAAARQTRTPPPAAILAVFQPREESIPSGALDVVASPEWAAHDVRAAIAAHVQPLLPAGSIAATPGPVNAAVSNIEITITGPGGHAAYPHATHDPVLALSEVVVSVQQAVSRRISPTSAAVLSIGMLRAGTAPGVIPATAQAWGTLRALSPADLDTLETVVAHVAEHVALAHGCQAATSFDRGEPVLVNDEQLTRHARHLLSGSGAGLAPELRSCGADDFAYYAQRHPGLMMFVGVDSSDQRSASLHQPSFYPPDDAVLRVADTLLCGFAAACALLGE
jgi:amidohydrolase